MIDRTKLPDFLQNMPEERLKEIMEIDNNSGNFDKAMDKMLHINISKNKSRNSYESGEDTTSRY